MKRGREGADDGADDSKHRRLDTDAAPAGGGGARAAEASSARSAEPAADEPSGGQREPLSQASRGAGVDATGVAPAGELQGARDAPAEPSDGGGADEGAVPGSGTHPVPGQAEEEEDEDLDAPVMPQPQRMRVRKGTECPYLDTISRQNLDFDFEKCCSVSLSPVNVYACLVCGKYFQGRGQHTYAYTHALETGHHMFMKLADGRVYCLPEGYEVEDRSLDTIRYVLNPTFTPAQVGELDKDKRWVRALDGTEYMPGLVGLNNMKANDYVNAIVQALARVTPLRDFFLLPANYAVCSSPLVQRFGELLRKAWNTRNFKGQVSPHEFMQAVMATSGKRFVIDRQADPVDFLSWFLNALHADLTGGKRKKPSVVTRCFQGELEITAEAGADGKAPVPQRTPFLMLGLDLPPAPLYKDALERNIIPQVPIFELLRKFDGARLQDDIKAGRRRYRLTCLPAFLVLHVKRFTKNNFFLEKNPTIVNFPVRNLELRDIVPVPSGTASKYDLVANLVHDGAAGRGVYRAHIQRRSEGTWYEVQDLHVVDILPQMVVLSETYAQIYERQAPGASRTARAAAA